MRISFVLLFVSLLACTKQNPNLCCVDEADCAAIGLSEVTGCGEGLLCRGNQCIAEVCETSAECDADAPYCQLIPDGRCQPVCTDNSQCPGFGQSSSQVFCESGACVECRADENDCSGATPVCNAGQCVGCTTNAQCASGACGADGSCEDESLIAYVSPTGATSGECTRTNPCSTIEVAMSITPARPIIVIESGTYSRATSLALTSGLRLIGRGLTRPILRRTTTGAIITIENIASITIENLEITGATSGTGSDTALGYGIACVPDTAGARSVKIVDSVLHANTAGGLRASQCSVEALRSQFIENGTGASLTDSTAVVDRSTFSGNSFAGMIFDGGVLTLTNSFITRNANRGLEVFGNTGTRVEFNTIVDNATNGTLSNEVGFACSAFDGQLSTPNNIIARNRVQTFSLGCTFPSSIIIDADISTLMFVSPNTAPFDYHIQTGSIAVDMATITTIDHDFDGNPRPTSGADVGADEL